MVHRYGQRVFLDLKLHDIPNTVAGAARRIAAAGVGMFNLHASAGHAAMAGAARAAAEAAAERGRPKPIVLGVTVLTSLGPEDLRRLNIGLPLEEQVESLALQAAAAGLDGVVCAGAEARMIKRACGDAFVTVVPGVRPAWAGANDQKRAMTPAEALQNGADFLVIARPILAADDRRAAADRILAEMEAAVNA